MQKFFTRVAVFRFLFIFAFSMSACADHDKAIVPPPLDIGMENVAVVKARRTGDDYLLLFETLAPLADVERPDRVLRRFHPDGSSLVYTPPAGTTLADFAAHLGGAVSILLVTDAGYALEQWMVDGSCGGAVEIAGVAPTDWSRDAGRVVQAGNDDVVLAVHAKDDSIHAFRYARDGAGYQQRWDALVEPPNQLLPTSITSGSFDTFGQLRNLFHVYVDVDPNSTIWVGVQVDLLTDLVAKHNAAFGEDLHYVGDPASSSDILVTQLDDAGHRIFSRMVGTEWNDEVYGVRAISGELLIVGRSRTTPGDAGGWDGLVARVGKDGTISVRTVDVDAGDIFFDANVLPDGRTVTVGGAGYTQNPTGASISETCSLLALVLTEEGRVRLPLPSLPRHNHLRTLLTGGTNLWVAGLSDGPGTHSGDADPSAIRAQPFTAMRALP